MKGIDVVHVSNKEIIIVDYSNCNEGEMIELVVKLGGFLQSRNKPARILAIYDARNFLTPKYMRQAERTTSETIHLINKIAFIGLSTPRQMILKGYNYLFKKNFKSFQLQEDALVYLVDDNE